MLTADTITDAQIRELARTALTAGQHQDCSIALNARREMLTLIGRKLERLYPTTKHRRAARARCAELLNARARITDAQIRKLRRSKEWPAMWLREFAIALGEVRTVNDPQGDFADARGRCERLINGNQ